MSTSRHVAFDGLGLGDVDYRVEQVRFTMLAAEILDIQQQSEKAPVETTKRPFKRHWRPAYPADDIVVVR